MRHSISGPLTAIASFFLIAACTPFGPAIFFHPADAHFEEDRIRESSGLIKSRQFDRLFWTHNDSGHPPLLFALNRDGRSVGAVDLAGAANLDWEDITIDDAGFLYLCDIGNNRNVKVTFTIYQIPEVDPRTSRHAAVFRRFRFRYPGSRSPDAEACFFSEGALYILTKEPTNEKTTLYRLSLLDPDGEETATEVGRADLEGSVTGAALSPDGTLLAVLTYGSIYFFIAPESGDNYLAGPSRRTPLFFGQSEAIAWDGDDLIVTNEAGGLLRLQKMNRFGKEGG